MARPSLMTLAIEYFTRRGYEISKVETNEKFYNGVNFDLIVSKRNQSHPVRVKEWNRTVGVNIVINLDQATQESRWSTPILVADKFSDHAKSYSNRRGIMLITRSEIMRSLR